ncbi:Uncharacterized protein HZ326_17467 [Fusarium oxysporum f. sp. albedinis]|nr:Uncharacterized protein HZ326_17467 [Fusarium oxysporum f. sp. albedinis]
MNNLLTGFSSTFWVNWLALCSIVFREDLFIAVASRYSCSRAFSISRQSSSLLNREAWRSSISISPESPDRAGRGPECRLHYLSDGRGTGSVGRIPRGKQPKLKVVEDIPRRDFLLLFEFHYQ